MHKLRPGDIDVVAAIGDSLVAGSGALEEFALGAIVEYRGVSWCAGVSHLLFSLNLMFNTFKVSVKNKQSKAIMLLIKKTYKLWEESKEARFQFSLCSNFYTFSQ